LEKNTRKRRAREAKLKALRQAIGGEKITPQHLMEFNSTNSEES